jgi:hypothetical protein
MSLADSHAKGNYIVGVKTSILGANVVNEAKEDLGTIEVWGRVLVDETGVEPATSSLRTMRSPN